MRAMPDAPIPDAAPSRPSLPVPSGSVLAGRYRVEEPIGEGATGVVARAYDVALGRPVAVKLLRPLLATEEVIERFRREAVAMQSVESPHVARVLDFGTLEGEGGFPFLVMEHLEGWDLARVLRHVGSLSVPDAVDCMMQACHALVAAHGAGVVHRDLKPANLFLSRDPLGVPFVKVLDFGVSKILDRERVLGKGAQEMTGAFTMLGSPRYAAPEQIRSSRDVDARVDVYSVGAVLFHLVAGRPPFEGASAVQASILALTEPPPRLDDLTDAPKGLADTVDACLAKERDGRPASARALAELLAPFASAAGRAVFEPPRPTIPTPSPGPAPDGS